MMKTKWKENVRRLLAGILAGSLLLGMAGCKSGTQDAQDKETAMGRYLEEEIPLPEGLSEIIDAGYLSDGTMALLGCDEQYMARYWLSSDGGETWEEQGDIPQELGLEDGEDSSKTVTMGAIREDGTVLCQIGEYVSAEGAESPDDIEYKESYQLRSPDGSYTEVNLQLPEDYTQGIRVQWVSDDEILLQDSVVGLYQMNVSDGSVIRQYVEDEGRVVSYGLVENHLILASPDSIDYYNVETGDLEEEDTVLSDQIKSSGSNENLTSYNTFPMLICQAGQDGQMLYCDSTGIYSHVIGGNAMEQIVDGKLTSIGDPSTGLIKMFMGEDNTTLYLGVSTEEGVKLLRYVYSEDTPSVPSKEIKVYTLQENLELQQAISMFQKENPDYYVSLETALSEDSSVTLTDALKTLNTEIMAGKGPDLLVLDGMPIATYEERGILADISDVIQEVDEKEGILDNLQKAYDRDGAVYEFPGRFSIPLVFGPKDQIQQLQTLSGMAQAAKDSVADSSGKRFYVDTTPSMLAETLMDSTYPAWIQKDGTLDEKALREFFQAIKEIYDADDHNGEAAEAEENMVYGTYSHQQMSFIDGMTLQVYGGEGSVVAGNLSSASGYSQLTSSEQAEDGENMGFALWNGQKAGCFSPSMIMGINSKSKNQEDAKEFLKFLYSQKAQEVSMGYGLPVNETVYDSEDYWTTGEGTTVGYTIVDETGTEKQVYLDVHKPTAEQIQQIQEMGKSLTTSSQLDDNVVEAVRKELDSYAKGESDLDSAISAVVQKVNLYLAE